VSFDQLLATFGPVGALLIVAVVALWVAYQKSVAKGYEREAKMGEALSQAAQSMTLLAARIESWERSR
jgi:hypothetical protein